MGNCMMCWPNRVDAATLIDPLGDWSAMPVTNLQNRYLRKVARTGGLPVHADENGDPFTARIDVLFERTRYTVASALVNHNLSTDAEIRRVYWADAAMTEPLSDSGYKPVWPRWYDWRDLRWGDLNFWGGRIDPEQLGNVPAIYLDVLAYRLAAPAATFYLNDPGNAAGYLEAGRLVMAEDFTPVRNATFGASIGVVDPTIVDEALDGTEHFEDRTRYRQVIFKLPYLGVSEGVNKALLMDLDRGISGDVLFIWDPDAGALMQQRSFLGRFQELSALEFPQVTLTSKAYKIKELV